MTETVEEIYVELGRLITEVNRPLSWKYRCLRELLERVIRERMQDTNLQITDLSARINYIASQFSLNAKERMALHTFRLTSNEVLNRRKEAEDADFLRDSRSIAEACSRMYACPIPVELEMLLPSLKRFSSMNRERTALIHRVRVCFQYADENFLYVLPADEVSEECWKIHYDVDKVNQEFTDDFNGLWKNAQLNLLDVKVHEDGTYTPSFFVLEPDYLIDISSLAECFRDYGSHPGNYFMSRLMPIKNARPLLLGNIANLFLDEWIHSGQEAPDYVACMKKAFREYPIELAVCEDLRSSEGERKFASDCRMHFEHIRQTVQQTFLAPGYNLNKEDAVLEPAYICEALGLQGRLDYMQRDMSSFIEMKSGKGDEYSLKDKIVPKENNLVQMLLYMAVLEYNMGIDRKNQHPYLLYTRYPLLYPARASWAHLRRVIHLRNQIVAAEYGVQLHNHPSYTAKLLSQINPKTLNQKGLKNRLWTQYLCPEIIRFQQKLSTLDSLEQAYFYALYNFITKELYTSKVGTIDAEGKKGAAMLWLNTLEEKRESGEILYDLQIVENSASLAHKPTITLAIPTSEDSFLPNFRKGDVVVLYERNNTKDNVTNKLVIKGNVEEMTDTLITIRLRASQRNLSVFPSDSLYAVEHDYMDTTFRSMYLGLSAFMEANKERRDLLLARRKPEFDETVLTEEKGDFIDDFERVATKALATKDYFLLVGPPGTGKTSRALRRMVERFYGQADTQILLLAYTNRAVDEICASLDNIIPKVDYIRVGSELSCDVRFRNHLLENVLEFCQTRRDVLQRLSACRIYVGTVASLSSKTEWVKLKHFNVAIVDEASQILEPQLLWILTAKSSDGNNAVDKFILIGDHKQLPAVVLQSSEQSEVHDENLRNAGLLNLKDSLFERLYRSHLLKGDTNVLDMICNQGRMHPDIASFPNQAFYDGKLKSVGLPHQLENLVNPVLFIPSVRDKDSFTGKTNSYEARLSAQLAVQVWKQYGKHFDSNRTLGIITPYRSQITLIRRELQTLGVPELMDVSVDTVERYQGSERDVIIYSFCVNYIHQLEFLPNLTTENGVLIDRKLNVALTRARRQLYLIGVPELLNHNPIYRQLIEYCNNVRV